MKLSDEEKKELQKKFERLKKAPEKPCRWLKQRLDYAYAWSVGFISGVLSAINMND